MQWIVDNWLILLLLGGMLAMHLFGHGHGGHGGHGRGGKKPNTSDEHAGHEHETRDTKAGVDGENTPASGRSRDDGRT